MATKIVIPIQSPDGHGSFSVLVNESFDEVLDRVAPLTGQASSALEHRQRCVYTTTDGDRVWIPPQAVAWAEENAVDGL